MTMISPSDQTTHQPIKWSLILQLAFSALAALLLFGAAGFIIITSLSTYLTHGRNPADLTEPFMVAGSLVFAGALIIPSAWYSWRQLAHPDARRTPRTERRGYGLILSLFVIAATGLALFAGNLISQNDQIAWLFMPLLNIVVNGLPALWLIYFGTRGLLPDSPRHKWGVFATGLVLGPAIILVLEIILLVVVAVLAITLILVQDPSLSSQLSGLMNQIRSSGTNTQSFLDALLPYALNPGVLFLGLAYISVLVPLIEETFKPIGVWFTAGNKITPAMGFGFGVLSGAGFGLFENLGNTSGATADWAVLAGSRITTLLLHSFTAGLVGWALASAWTERRFLRLAFSFTIAVLIHGTWNGLAVLSAGASLQNQTSLLLPAILMPLGVLATLGIFALGVLVVFGFFGFNAYLRRTIRLQALASGGVPGSQDIAGSSQVPFEPFQPNEPSFTGGNSAEMDKAGKSSEPEDISPVPGEKKTEISDVT
jgi:RsiW-degrading membrane proteinase PrsW (M82 family)